MQSVSIFRWTATLLAAALFTSCNGTYPQRTAATGALIGAGTGALIGSARGNAGRGALIGAAAGGIAGGVYGRQRVRHSASFYGPTYGYVNAPYLRPINRHPASFYPYGARAYRPHPYRFCY